MRSRLFKTRRRKALVVVVAAGVLASAAWAAWTVVVFNRDSTGKTATIVQPNVVAATETEIATTAYDQGLPGTDGDSVIKVDNPNDVALTLTAAASPSVALADSTGCTDPTWITARNPSAFTAADGIATATVAANASGVLLILKDSYTVSSNAPNGCQGKVVIPQHDLTFTAG